MDTKDRNPLLVSAEKYITRILVATTNAIACAIGGDPAGAHLGRNEANASARHALEFIWLAESKNIGKERNPALLRAEKHIAGIIVAMVNAIACANGRDPIGTHFGRNAADSSTRLAIADIREAEAGLSATASILDFNNPEFETLVAIAATTG
jgi:hypothetical protein